MHALPSPGTRLTRRRIYILPTREGMIIALVLLVMLLGSANYDNGLGYLLAFLIASLALVSMVHAYRNLAGLLVICTDADAVHSGGRAGFSVVLDNRGGRPRSSLVIRVGGDARRAPVVAFTDVAGDAIERCTLALDAARRGWMEMPPVTIATRYPLGLFRAWSVVRGGARCLVWPRAEGNRAPPVALAAEGHQGSVRGAGREDFAGLRDYRRGDAPARIHWRRATSGESLPVKLFSGSGPGVVQLHWDAVAGDDTETRLSQLCRWVVDAEASGARYELVLPELAIEAAAGDPHRRACLRALALHGVDP